jgi:4-amino-4-deoxy-L-arabinose transferase-like glycosyltransferase
MGLPEPGEAEQDSGRKSMTATAQYVDENASSPPLAAPTASGAPRRWRWLALTAICLIATALYAWRIGSEGWGNPYYAAAVKSMSQNVTNFVFGSFDPAGVVTVDKPPLALWAMVASTAIFGFHSWAVLLPQVIEGVAAVFLLHRTVRRWAGENAALLAALVLALTPVTVAIDRDSNPDTMMVLLLVAAAYAFTRSVESAVARAGATGWLALASFFLGLGFVAKMLQAWIVVPAFALAYLVGARTSIGRRVVDLLVGGVALLAGSMWWVALVSVWPQPKPYIGGSTDGSVLNLVIGYNGLGRVLGRGAGQAIIGGPAQAGGAGGFRGHGGGGGGFMGGQAGLTRLFAEQVGGQISWLLPLCLIVLVVVGVAGVRRMRARATGDPRWRAGWFLWGGWLLLVFAVLSLMQNQFHPYYTTEMAPAIGAVSGAGLPVLWRHYRRPGGYGWLLLPAAVLVTAGWAWVVVSRDLTWNGWVRYAVAVVAIAAVIALVVVRLGQAQGPRAVGGLRIAGVLAVVALVLAPGAWSAGTAFASSAGGAMAQAGPPRSAFGGARGIQQRLQHSGMGANPAFQRMADQLARGQMPQQARSMMSGSLNPDQRAVLSYVSANSGNARITLAVEGGAMAAESYLLNSDATVIGMGGFSGGDPAPTVQQLAQWVQQGQLRYVLVSQRGGGFGGGGQHGGAGAQQRRGGTAGGAAQPGRGFGGFGSSAATTQRIQWVQQHCTVVPPSAYGGTSSSAEQSTSWAFAGAQTLYDCRA